jgi:predicted phage terminase large subunit-like protein
MESAINLYPEITPMHSIVADDKLATDARDYLINFCQLNHRQYNVDRVHTQIANALESVAAGHIKRLMIFVHPRTGKSEIASKQFPAWFLGHYPDKSIIDTSYSLGLAGDFSRATRDIMGSSNYLSVFDTRLKYDSKSAHRWNTEQGGGLIAAGVGGPITGRGADILLIDDPVKNREEADSKTIREKVWKWYTSTAYTRLEPDGGAIVLIMTRWHEDDLAGRLLAAMKDGGQYADQWEVLSLPAIDDDGVPLGARGFTLADYERIREVVGPRDWNALYQQNPTPQEGGIFKLEWWGQYNGNEPEFTRIVQSWDTAFKKGEDNDYSVCITLGKTGNAVHVLDVYRVRLEYPELVRMVKAKHAQYAPQTVLIEDKASGKRETHLPILAVKVDSDKVSRAYAVTGYVEAGKVLLPETAPWLAEFMSELGGFPNATHDDQVDSFTQGLNYMNRGSGFWIASL